MRVFSVGFNGLPFSRAFRMVSRIGTAALLAAGCTDTNAGHTVFPDSTGFTSTMRTQAEEITDIGFEPFYNLTGDHIRLRGAAFVSPPPELRVLNVRAYDYRQTRETVMGQAGDLAKECPHLFKPKPISSYLTPPHGSSSWFVVIAFTISKPGRYILEGVDALVRDGYADPDQLAVGGYSYGGYMTNWLITQTTRFKAAVTGAGAVEHAANWGNDDETWDDAWYLGGRPWENAGLYQSEAALFQFNKVKTPTHLVQGGADIRVSYLEGVTMERALDALNVPHSFLVFPGEGHGLPKNPWHGYIKLREELKWLDTYANKAPAGAQAALTRP